MCLLFLLLLPSEWPQCWLLCHLGRIVGRVKHKKSKSDRLLINQPISRSINQRLCVYVINQPTNQLINQSKVVWVYGPLYKNVNGLDFLGRLFWSDGCGQEREVLAQCFVLWFGELLAMFLSLAWWWRSEWHAFVYFWSEACLTVQFLIHEYCKVPCKRPLPCKRPPPTSELKLCKGWCTK